MIKSFLQKVLKKKKNIIKRKSGRKCKKILKKLKLVLSSQHWKEIFDGFTIWYTFKMAYKKEKKEYSYSFFFLIFIKFENQNNTLDDYISV